MGKLCPRGKAAAKRKFKVYPSAYANMYASAVCSGKVTPGGKKKKASGGDGGGRINVGGGGDYGSYLGAGLGRRPKQLGDSENIPAHLRMLQYMVNVHKGNPYTKLAMRKKDGGLATLVGD